MIRYVPHCHQGMRANSVPLSKGTQVLYTCEVCHHQEVEWFSASGRPLRWVNLSVKRRIGEHVAFVSP